MLSDYRDRDGASKGDKAETQLLRTKEWNKLILSDNPRSPEVVTVDFMGNVFWNYLCWKKALMGDLRVPLVRGFVPVCSQIEWVFLCGSLKGIGLRNPV